MPILCIENASTGGTVRKNYGTATPSQVTGHPASALTEEPQGSSWRTATDNPADCTALVRFERDRSVGTFHGTNHNLGRHGCWRTVLDDEYAIRPVWETDGVSDKGQTTAAIPTSASVTLVIRLWLLTQTSSHNTTQLRLLEVANGSGSRFELFLRQGDVATPWIIYGRVSNWGASTQTSFSSVTPNGQYLDLGVRYDNSTQLFEVLSGTTVIASTTATTAWSDNGAERLTIGCSDAGAQFTRIVWQDIQYWAEALPDATLAAYNARVLDGTEKNLSGSWHFLEGTGTSVADSTGTATMTLTGGTWSERANPAPSHSIDTTAWGPWTSRQALELKPGISAKSPIISTTPRSFTLAATIHWPADAALVDGGIVAWLGPSEANAELMLETTSSGEIRARSKRGGPVTITSTSALNDGNVHYVRAVLDGYEQGTGPTAAKSHLEFYVGAPGTAEASQGAAVECDAFATLADSRLGVGDSTATTEATVRVSDVRAYDRVILEADDSMSSDAPAWRTGAWAMVRLDGAVVDGVDTSRTYTTTGSLSYTRIRRTDAHGGLEAGEDLLAESTADPFAGYSHHLLADIGQDVTASEALIQLDDRGHAGDATDGYLELTSAYIAATIRPLSSEHSGIEISGQRRPARAAVGARTSLGGISSGEGFRAAGWAGQLKVLTNRMGHTAPSTTVAEIDTRMFRRPAARTLLVAIWLDPTVAQHRLVENVVVGYIQGESSPLATIGDVFDAFPLEIVGVNEK